MNFFKKFFNKKPTLKVEDFLDIDNKLKDKDQTIETLKNYIIILEDDQTKLLLKIAELEK